MSADVKSLLSERNGRYGSFEGHAHLAQKLKRIMHNSPNWGLLTDVQREGLDMIQHKIARMLNGDPNYLDNVVDIVGYSMLVKEAMEKAYGSEMD
jgi:hypothetical protein